MACFKPVFNRSPSRKKAVNTENQSITNNYTPSKAIMGGSGKLKVKVLNGRQLQNKETFQTSDPYCMIEIGDKTSKTKHVTSNLNPDWNEEFEFMVSEGNDVLTLSIWDKNTIKKDVFMGYAFVSIHDCQMGENTPKVVQNLAKSFEFD